MNIFAAGTETTLDVPLTDASGNVLAVDGITYVISDETGAWLHGPVVMEDFAPGSDVASIVIPADINTLAPGVGRSLRSIDLQCTIGTNITNLQAAYVVSIPDPLVVGLNSFASYSSLQFAAMEIPSLTGWDNASQMQRMAALITAREHITRLSFTGLALQPAQNSLDFIPEGSYETRAPGSLMNVESGLDMLTPDQFKRLPAKFIAALTRAQLVEADALLGGDAVGQRRADGLVQDDVGESRQTYRNTKPLQLPVCRRALGYLSLYVSFAKRIGRC